MPLVIALGLVLLMLGILENLLHRRNLESVPLRILVNGTRGKSSVTRMIAGALREAGIRTIAKTTGSEARIILEDGSETPVRRPFGPRITEQKALASLAAERHAQALVVECMAVRPESQATMQRHLVRSTIGVITNARVDHVEEMGPTLDGTREALALAIPRDGTLVTPDPRFAGKARRTVVVDASTVGMSTLARFSHPAFAENVALALGVVAELGIDSETAIRGMAKAQPDIGVLRLFSVERPGFPAIVASSFAANDLVSTRMACDETLRRTGGGRAAVMLYNNRADREYRIEEFLGLPRHLEGLRLIACCGDRPAKVAKAFSGLGYETMSVGNDTGVGEMLDALGGRIGGGFLLFGVGNIAGPGLRLVRWCMEHAAAYDPAGGPHGA